MKPSPYFLAAVLLLLPLGLKSHGAEALPDLREPSSGDKILFRLSLLTHPTCQSPCREAKSSSSLEIYLRFLSASRINPNNRSMLTSTI